MLKIKILNKNLFNFSCAARFNVLGDKRADTIREFCFNKCADAQLIKFVKFADNKKYADAQLIKFVKFADNKKYADAQ